MRQVLSGPGIPALGHGLLATALCAVGLAVLLLPQCWQQRPMVQGVVSVHLAADGRLTLWNQPVASAELLRRLASPSVRRRLVRLRIVPDPDTPWGDVRRLLTQLDSLPLPLELQLPASPPPAG